MLNALFLFASMEDTELTQYFYAERSTHLIFAIVLEHATANFSQLLNIFSRF